MFKKYINSKCFLDKLYEIISSKYNFYYIVNKNDKSNCINYLTYAKINKEEKELNNDLLNIEIIREYIAKRKIDWTKHCLNRLNQRNILISDVKTAINNGRILLWWLSISKLLNIRI